MIPNLTIRNTIYNFPAQFTYTQTRKQTKTPFTHHALQMKIQMTYLFDKAFGTTGERFSSCICT